MIKLPHAADCLLIAAAVASVVVGVDLAACEDPSHLKPAASATIAAGNAALCPLWMPLASTALASAAGPFAGLLAGALTCAGEEAGVAALLAELTATPPAVDAGAGVGVATAAITASRPGLVPITRHDGSVVLLAPAGVAAQCQAAQSRIDARAAQ